MVYPTFWKRFVAYLIDAILLSLVHFILMFSFLNHFFQIPAQGIGGDLNLEKYFIMLMFRQIVVLVLCLAYSSFLESSKWQGTIGKKLVGIKVTDLNGNRISFARAFSRFFAKILSFLSLFIGFIIAGFTSKKQALHDMIARTLVLTSSSS